MAHCPVELLDDLGDVLAEVRGWAGVKEDSPGVFYVRREPFLHFHLLKGGRRPVATSREAQMLRRAVRAHYREKRGDA
jgi:hypothetical protein